MAITDGRSHAKRPYKKISSRMTTMGGEHTLSMSLQAYVVKDLINRSAASQTDRRLGVSMITAHNHDIPHTLYTASNISKITSQE